MWRIALQMLINSGGKYYGLIFGIFFASLVMTQQLSIFLGLMARTYGFLTDTALPDIWVMDPKVQYVDDIKPLQDTRLLAVRGIQGVDWAVPLYKGQLRARLESGTFQTCNVIGIDDSTLIGGPARMLEGKLSDLRRADSVIVDRAGAMGKLAKPPRYAGGPREPLKVGDTLELNDNRAVVVGIADVTRTFQSQPVIYTTYSRAVTFAPRERKLLSFILVKAKPGVDGNALKARITKATGLTALAKDEFEDVTIRYFLKYTGIPINFGIAVALGFIVGTAIAGQTLYGFVSDNIRYFGTLKAMGATNRLLLGMVVLQACFVAVIGYGLGVGVASMTYFLSKNSELAFKMPWQLLAGSAGAVMVITILAASVSAIKVARVEPAIVFRG